MSVRSAAWVAALATAARRCCSTSIMPSVALFAAVVSDDDMVCELLSLMLMLRKYHLLRHLRLYLQ